MVLGRSCDRRIFLIHPGGLSSETLGLTEEDTPTCTEIQLLAFLNPRNPGACLSSTGAGNEWSGCVKQPALLRDNGLESAIVSHPLQVPSVESKFLGCILC